MAARYGKRWRERVTVGHDERGRAVERVVYGKTKAEAIAKGAAIRLARADGVDLVNDALTVDALVLTWLNTVVKPNREVATYDVNLQQYQRYIAGPLGRHQAKNLTVPQVQIWINELAGRLAPSTVRRARATLSAALNYGIKIRLFTFNAAAHVDMPRADRRPPAILDSHQLVRLLDHTSDIYMWGALYHLAAMTGLREEELRGLAWDDFDFEAATVHVQRALKFSLRAFDDDGRRNREWVFGPVKTALSRDTVDLTPDTVAALKAHRGRYDEWRAVIGAETDWTERGLVFLTGSGNPLHQSNIGSTLGRHLQEAGLPYIRFHALRHSYAALLIAADVNPKSIQDAMRHASIRTTLDTYGHLIRAKQTERLMKLGALMDTARDRAGVETPFGSDTDRLFEHNVGS